MSSFLFSSYLLHFNCKFVTKKIQHRLAAVPELYFDFPGNRNYLK